MRLFHALFKTKMPRGHIFRGKNRLVKQVEPKHLDQLKNQFQMEEKNMFLLRHPYLTMEQSSGHSQALKIQENRIDKFNSVPRPYYNNVTIESRLGHLRLSESWDV